jgi:hypothetical protein
VQTGTCRSDHKEGGDGGETNDVSVSDIQAYLGQGLLVVRVDSMSGLSRADQLAVDSVAEFLEDESRARRSQPKRSSRANSESAYRPLKFYCHAVGAGVRICLFEVWVGVGFCGSKNWSIEDSIWRFVI